MANNLDRYERGSEPVARSRSRRKKGKLPKSLIRIGVFLVAFVALLLLIIFSARACARSGEAKAYATYMSEVQQIVAASDEIGTQLTSLLTNPGDISRADVQTRLEAFVNQCTSLETRAIELRGPQRPHLQQRPPDLHLGDVLPYHGR